MKAHLVEQIAIHENIALKEVVAVGDGGNDRQMLQKAGLAIAYHAKEILKCVISHHLNVSSMDCLSFLIIGNPSNFVKCPKIQLSSYFTEEQNIKTLPTLKTFLKLSE